MKAEHYALYCGPDPWERRKSAAIFLAVLAYPEDTAKRDGFIEAVKLRWLDGAWKAGAPKGKFRRKYRRVLNPRYSFHNEVEKPLKRFEQRIRKRLMAAEAFDRQLFSRVCAAMAGGKPMSFAQAHRSAVRNAPENFLDGLQWRTNGDQDPAYLRREARETWPVLNLAWAFMKTFPKGADLLSMIDAPNWLEAMIDAAEHFREQFPGEGANLVTLEKRFE
ncbi:hypothetical protein [Thalassospira sp.]|uniref:hypothetical protein n=1 Tax=Thalassospira sp. TaxID=1912094 RepID=UPI001B188FA2|nr:hypothetical protein [Thalassospira sp.]MBO6807275.1 hypothetical protein [Thalassospira sp.]MBO6841682.1 hypothetical protein [Thalassospira sp.]